MKATTIIMTAAAISLASCSGSSSTQNSASGSTATTTDTIAAEAPAPAEEFITHDLIYADVKGHVKKVSDYNAEYGESNAIEFDTDGRLSKTEYLDYVKFDRDAESRIIGGDNGYYTVVWENGRVAKTSVRESDGTVLSEIFSYDGQGRVVKAESRSEEGPENDYSITYSYTYSPDSFDKHGNWIKRKVHPSDPEMKDFTQERRIYYY